MPRLNTCASNGKIGCSLGEEEIVASLYAHCKNAHNCFRCRRIKAGVYTNVAKILKMWIVETMEVSNDIKLWQISPQRLIVDDLLSFYSRTPLLRQLLLFIQWPVSMPWMVVCAHATVNEHRRMVERNSATRSANDKNALWVRHDCAITQYICHATTIYCKLSTPKYV